MSPALKYGHFFSCQFGKFLDTVSLGAGIWTGKYTRFVPVSGWVFGCGGQDHPRTDGSVVSNHG